MRCAGALLHRFADITTDHMSSHTVLEFLRPEPVRHSVPDLLTDYINSGFDTGYNSFISRLTIHSKLRRTMQARS